MSLSLCPRWRNKIYLFILFISIPKIKLLSTSDALFRVINVLFETVFPCQVK